MKAMMKRLPIAALLVLLPALAGCVQPGYYPIQPAYGYSRGQPNYGYGWGPPDYGLDDSDYRLGLRGEEVTPENIRSWRAEAGRGDAQAQARLGLVYAFGWGVREDAAEAVRWYRRAADQGLAAAQYNLATMYESGSGVPQDYVTAHLWYNLAAASFPPGSARTAAMRRRDGLNLLLTPDQLAEAQRLARQWRQR